MKKSAIALAVAAALGVSAAQATTTLYGSARLSVDYVKDETRENDDGFLEVTNNSSRLGVRGSEDLGNGLRAIYQYEFGVDPTSDSSGAYFNSDRPRFVGLEGPFGTIRIGTFFTTEYDVLGIVDIFNGRFAFAGSSIGSRIGKSVRYDSPSFFGLQISAQARLDGLVDSNDTDDEEFLDNWLLAARYENGPIIAGLTYHQNESVADEGKRWGAAVGYDAGFVAVGLTYERGNFFGDSAGSINDGGFIEGDDYFNIFQLGADFSFGNNVVRGYFAYQQFDNDLEFDDGEEDTILLYGIGFQHSLSKRTRVWVEYGGANEPDTLHTVSVGMRHDF